jgi:choline transport protein
LFSPSSELTGDLCAAYAYPTDAESMNYNSVIFAGVVALTGFWWVVHGIRNYPGPKLMHLYIHDDSTAPDASSPKGEPVQEKTVG